MSLKKVLKDTQGKYINMVLNDTDVATILTTAFGLMFNSSDIYLAMCNLDNNPKIKKYIMEPTDFITLLEYFQKRYNIFKYGYNVFMDGNVVYVLNKRTPNAIEVFKPWTYKFTLFDEAKYKLMGNYPIKIDPDKKEVILHYPNSLVNIGGHIIDGDVTSNVNINADKGKITTSDPTTAAIQTISIDNYKNSDTPSSKDDKSSNSSVGSVSKSNKLESINNNHYTIATIHMPNSFFTFIPGDIIEINSIDVPELTWVGTVKRWISEQLFEHRGLYVIATGKVEDRSSIFGNTAKKLAVKNGISKFLKGKLLTEKVAQINKTIDVTKSSVNELKTYTDKIRNFDKSIKQVLNDNKVSAAIADTISKGVDSVIDSDTVDLVLNTAVGMWNDDIIGGRILKPTISRISAGLGIHIGSMIGVYGSGSTIKRNNDIYNKLSKYSELPIQLSHNYIGDGYDADVNIIVNLAIINNNGIFKEFCDKYKLTEEEVKVLQDDFLKGQSHNAIKKHPKYLYIDNAIMAWLRSLRKTLTSEQLTQAKNAKSNPHVDNYPNMSKEEYDNIMSNINEKMNKVVI